MTRQDINIGSAANDGTGDPLRVAFNKVNSNFTELYDAGYITANSLPVNLSELENDVEFITANSIPTSLSQLENDVEFITAGSISTSLVPEIDSEYDLGSLTNQWKSLYVSANAIFIGGTPLSIDESGNLLVDGSPISTSGGTTQLFLELTNNSIITRPIELGEEISFEKEDYATGNTAIDFIDDGLALTRGNQNYLYNPLEEESVDRDVSPVGTLWNVDGWSDLSDFRSRDYDTFDDVIGGNLTEITDYEIIMYDTINDKYYKFDFSSWTQGQNGGGFAYTRALIVDPNFFRKADYATGEEAIDVIIEDDGAGSGIGITRGNNQGIYNPYREGGWNNSVSPAGTLWNIDGLNDMSDVETRTYTNFYDAYGGNLGNNVPGSKAIMYVPDNGKYYAIEWLSWTYSGEGGGFSYTRKEIDLSQLNEGVKFSDGSVQRSAYIETNVLSTAPNNRRIETQEGFNRIQVTELIVGDTLETTAYASGANTTSIVINETQEFLDLYNQISFFDLQVSLDEETWINGRVTGFSSLPVRRYFLTLDEPITVTEAQTIYYRTRSGSEPVRWFRARGDYFRGAIIDFHAYSSRSGTIVGTIHIIRDNGEYNITHTEVKSGDQGSLSNLDIWLRTNNEREIWAKRSDGQSDTIVFHWHGKFFYGRESWD
jgi:hypothetical protein